MNNGRLWKSVGGPHRTLPVVVSYYTDPFYQKEAFELLRSCQLHQLDYRIEHIPPQGGGTWLENTNYKPTFLLAQARLFPDRTLLWLDADARVRRFPSLLDGLPGPIAFHTWEGKTPASGTVYLAGPDRMGVLSDWVKEVDRDPWATDQVCMARAAGANHTELPVDYCFIFDDARGVFTQDLPVIEHMQASRWTKVSLGKPRRTTPKKRPR